MITFNMILHVSCIMNKGSEGIGEQENNLCHTANKNIRRSTCVVCPGSLYPATFPRPMFDSLFTNFTL